MKRAPNRRKNLLILGGGHDQVAAYREARALGYYILGVDRDSRAIAAPLADRFFFVSTRDQEKIISACAGVTIDGVVSPASDAALESLYHLSRHFNSKYQPSWAAVKNSIDKAACLSLASGLGVRVPEHYSSCDPSLLYENARRFAFPLVVKPTDSSGSKGISLVNSESEVTAAVEKAREFSFSKAVIIEQLIVGTHYSAELFLLDGRIRLAAFSERTLLSSAHPITVEHLMPATLPAAILEEAHRAFTDICREAGVRDGPVNFDFIVDAQGRFFMIEMQARLAGNAMPLLVESAYKVNTTNLTLRLIMDEVLSFPPVKTGKPSCVIVIYSATGGTLKEVLGLREVKKFKAVKAIHLFVRPGQQVEAFTQSSAKIGYILLSHRYAEELTSARTFIREHVRLVIDQA